MLRGAFACLCVGGLAVLGVASAWAQTGVDRGSPTVVKVSIENDRLKLDFSDGITSPDVVVGYDAVSDSWLAIGTAVQAGPGCSLPALVVTCPEKGEDVTVDFKGTPGHVTLSPAGSGLDFDSRVRLGANNQSIVTSDGNDVVTTAEPPETAGLGDEIETLGGKDRISAGGAPDLIHAGGGDDAVQGGAGDDIISGGPAGGTGPDGSDVLEGGEGTDLVTYASRTDDVTATIGSLEEDQIFGDVENLTGGLGDDTLTGNGERNVLRGGDDGDDTFFGGTRNGADGADTFRPGLEPGANTDTVSYENRKDNVFASLSGGSDDVDGDDIDGDIDALIGGKGNDALTGDDDANTLVGGEGKDTMVSLGGPDLIDALDDGDDASNCGGGTDLAKTDVGATENVTSCEEVDGAPDTQITSAPEKRTTGGQARFKFASDTPDMVGFECRMDGAPFESCASPQVYKPVAVGKHVFEVRAVDDESDADPSPARLGFKRVPK